MNPWLAEQLVPSRMADLERAAHPQSRPQTALEPLLDQTIVRTRPALARHVGILLIAVGQRLAGPHTFPAAFEGPHRH
jgi:hypothetical protein